MKLAKVVCVFCLLVFSCSVSAQSAAVIKAGLVLSDHNRDSKSVFGYSQPGYFAGFDARLGAYDNMYFKIGGYYTRMNTIVQHHLSETSFFNIDEKYEYLKALVGVEWRVISTHLFNWRLSLSGAFNFVTEYEDEWLDDYHGAFMGVNASTGFDFAFLTADVSVERGVTDFYKKEENSYPLLVMVSFGFNF
jgi:hypothetical protein